MKSVLFINELRVRISLPAFQFQPETKENVLKKKNRTPWPFLSVSYLARYIDKPTDELWKAAKRIRRYLKDTQDLGLALNRRYSDLVPRKQSCVALSKMEADYVAGASSPQEL
ncbi:hypothetical protein PR048_005723, partial [Dryococelus australis]